MPIDPNKRRPGRPTVYTDKKAKAICDLIASEPRSLESLRKEYPRIFPSPTTLSRWIRDNEAFRTEYYAARATQTDLLVDECKRIIDSVDADGTNAGARVAKAKAQIEQRRWEAERLNPTRWGNRASTVHESADDAVPQGSSALDKRIDAYLRKRATERADKVEPADGVLN